MIVAFIAGPFTSKKNVPNEMVRNVERHIDLSFEVAEMGVVPLSVVSMWHYHYMRGVEESFWLDACQELLKRSDLAIFHGNWRDSSGSMGEYNLATAMDIPIFDWEKEQGQLVNWLTARTEDL